MAEHSSGSATLVFFGAERLVSLAMLSRSTPCQPLSCRATRILSFRNESLELLREGAGAVSNPHFLIISRSREYGIHKLDSFIILKYMNHGPQALELATQNLVLSSGPT